MNSPLIPEIGVNIFTIGQQVTPKIATLTDGSFVVVWNSEGQDGDLGGIFGQHYSAQGQRIGSEFLVNSTNLEIQRDPAIAATEDGGFVVVWEARNQDVPGSFDFGVFGQRFGADASRVGAEFQVNAVNTSFTQFNASVVGLPGGGFAVSFTDDIGDGSGAGIRVRLYDAAGVPAADDFQVNSTIAGAQNDSVVAAIQPDAGANNLINGGFVVVWGGTTDGNGVGIRAQVYQPDGTPVGAEISVNATVSGNQQRPDVVGLTGGRFAVVWDDDNGNDGSGLGVFARVFNGDGSAVTGDIQVNVEISSSQFEPAIAALDNGGFAVTWTSNTSGSAGDGNGQGVFTRSFDADGVPVTGEQQVNEEISSTQDGADVTQLSNGDFAVVWQSVTSGSAGDGSGTGVFLRLLGDPNTFVAPGAAPLVEAVSTVRVFDENVVNGAPQRIDADGAAAVSDSDSADFNGGRLIVTSLAQSVAEDDFPAQDADGQDRIGLDQTGGSPVAVSGADVSVSGTVVGTISADGADGAPLIIDLNANATAAAVEILVEHLTYQNTSDDPRANTTLTILLEDGDGSTSAPVVVDVQVNPENDSGVPVRGEVRVNSFPTNNQVNPSAATLFDPVTGDPDGYLVVWTSTNQDNPGDFDVGVFAQRYDANGQPAGAEFLVNQTVVSNQSQPHAAGLADGGFVIVWADNASDGSGFGVRATRYDANGAPVAGQIELLVNSETQSNQSQPRVAALSDGGYQVVWTSNTSGTAGDGSSNGVFTQRYNAAGAEVGGETQVNGQTAGSQDAPDIAALGAGRFVAVWQSDTNGSAGDGSGIGIFARLFDASGVPESGEFQVNTFINSTQSNARVETLAGGDFVVVWRSEGQDTSSGGIYGQRFSAAGAPVGTEFRVNDVTSGDQTIPDIIALDNGGFVVAWTDTSTAAPGSGADVHAQVFDADGTRIDSQVLINSDVLNSQQDVTLAALPGGNYVVAWESNNNPPNFDFDIKQQIIGDPADFQVSAPPQIIGLHNGVTLTETAANAGAQLVPGGAIVLTDPDSADFAGGSLILSRQSVDVNADDFLAPDDNSQDSLSVGTIGGITTVGTDVRFNGVSLGALVSDGQSGAPLQIDFNAGATIEAVEALLQALTYQNPSDNPRASRTYNLELTDGDGSVQDPFAFTIDVTQDADPGAAAPVGNESQVNTFTAGAQDLPEIATLTGGGWVVVWQSDAQDGSGSGVYGQRYNADGTRNGQEFRANDTLVGDQGDPQVAGLADGGWVIVWEGINQDNGFDNNFGIIGQRYDAAGAKVGGEFVVNTVNVASAQFDAAVAADPAGGFAVAWTTSVGDGSGQGIAYQRFDAAGAPAGGEIIVNQQTSSTQNLPALTYLSNGQILVVWTSQTSGGAGDGSGAGVFARILNANGTFAAGEFQINQEELSTQDLPSVAATAAGFVVAWGDASGQDGSGSGVQARFFANSGAPVTDEFTVNENRSSTQDTPDVTTLSDGRVLIAWQTQQAPGGSGTDVSGQLFTAAGERIDGEFRINTQISSTQSEVEVTALPNGDFVAVWQSETSAGAGDGSSRGIFQQVYGNPANFVIDAQDSILGLPAQVTLAEADVNAGLVRVDPDATAAVPPLGVSDFNGGVLAISADLLNIGQQQFAPPDDVSHVQLGLLAGDVGNGNVSFSGATVGSTVSVDGVVVGTITSDGANGAPLAITFNANADQESVEALLGNLGLSSASDDPEPVRLAVNLSNGAGTSTATAFIEVSFTPESDTGLVAGGERIVNAHTQEIQEIPQIAELAGGGYVVVWESRNQDQIADDFDRSVHGQRYDANGVPVGPEFQVNQTVIGFQGQPHVAALTGSGFVVVWTDNQSDGNSNGVRLTRYDANGAPVPGETEIIVNTQTSASQSQPRVAGLSDGGYQVIWTSQTSGGAGDGSSNGVITQRFDAAGVRVGGEVIVNEQTALAQDNADIAALAGGRFVVVWESNTSGSAGDGSNQGVFARLFDNTGTPEAGEFLVNTTTLNSQNSANVTALAGGGFVVVWQDNAADGSGSGIFGQIYDAAGATVGGEFRVNDTTFSTQASPSVAALANGGFVVGWDGNGPGDSSGTFVQVYDATGARVDSETQVNVATSSTQSEIALTGLAGGGFAAVFQAETSATSGDGSSRGNILRTFEPAQPASDSPSLRQLDIAVTLGANNVTAGPVILDNGVDFSDPDNTDFAGGSLEVYYTRGPAVLDQLSVVASGPIAVVGSDVQFNSTSIGTIDAAENGANGANLRIDFNASADALAVKAVIERIGFSSTDTPANVANTERGIGFIVTDGNGGQTEPDGIFVQINAGSINPTGLVISDFGTIENGTQQSFGPFSESALIAAPVVVDGAVDFDDFAGTSFDTGFVRLEESGTADARQQLSVQNQGTGAGQIGFNGTTVTFEGTAIGTVDAVQNGQNGADLQINLNASATADAVEALMEAFTFALSGATADLNPDLSITVRNQAGTQATSAQVVLQITQDVVTVLPAATGEEQVNTFTPNEQTAPRVAALADGGYLAVWTSTFQDEPASGNRGVFAQRYNEFGQEVGAEFQVNDIAIDDQFEARAAGLTNGGFVVLWTENFNSRDGSLSGVFGQRYNADGSTAGAAFQVNEETSSTQSQPEVVALDGGRFMTVWTSTASGPAGDGSGNGVFGRVFNAAGQPEGGEFQINTTTANSQQAPRLARLPDGDVLVVWEDNNGTDGSGFGVFAQRVDGTGTLVAFDGTALPPGGSQQVQVNTTTAGTQNAPAVAALAPSATLPAGGFVVVWETPDSSGTGVVAQIYALDGTPQGGEIQVNLSETSSQFEPMVAGTPDGGFIVTFSDNSGIDGSSTGVLAQAMNADGSRNGLPFIVSEETVFVQDQADLTTLANGSTVVVWRSNTFGAGSGGDGSGSGIFQTLLNQPPLPAGAEAPVLVGFEQAALFEEADVNAGLQLLDPDGVISLTDADSPDFNGGSILVSPIVGTSQQLDAQLGAPDDQSQDQIGLLAGNGVTLAGANVLVNGTIVGTVQQDGTAGGSFEVALNANATPEAVELVLTRLAYANASDDPAATRQYAVQVTDGDGGSTGSSLLTIDVTLETDLQQQPAGGDRQANTFFTGSQTDSAVATLFDPVTGNPNGYVIVWESAAQDRPQDGGTGVFGQVYDLNGQPAGGEFQVNTHEINSQLDPAVVGLATGGFAVAWTGPSPVTGQQETLLQIFDGAGSPVGGEIVTDPSLGFSKFRPALAAYDNGDFVLVHDAQDTVSPFEHRVVGQRYDDNGAAVGAAFEISAPGNETLFGADVAVLADGKTAVAFTAQNLDNPGDFTNGVFVQLFAANGTALGGLVPVNINVAGQQDEPRVAALEDGGYIVVWQDNSGLDGSGFATFQQRYDSNGVAVGGNVRVNDVTLNSQFDPDVIGLPGGGWVVTFSDNNGTDGSGQGVLAQVYAADGSRVDGNFIVNAETAFTQQLSSVAALQNGDFVVSFTSDTFDVQTNDGSGDGVFSRLFAAPGGATVSAAPQVIGFPAVLTLDEAVLNAGGARLYANVTVADSDSADFAGGLITVANVENGTEEHAFSPPDNAVQDQLSLATDGVVTVAGQTVSVNGTAVGTIVADGADGAAFSIQLNGNATPAAVEALVERIVYANISDDPADERQIALTIADGDGGLFREITTVTIAPQNDAFRPVADEVQTNSFTTGEQTDPHVATLFDPLTGTPDGYVIVWTSTNQDATGDNQNGVFGQRYDASGAPVGGEFLVNTITLGNQQNAQAVGLATGGFAVAWEGFDSATFQQKTFVQVYNDLGQKVGAEILADTSSFSHNRPALDAFDNGDFVLVRDVQNGVSPFQQVIVGQRFSDAGGTVGTEFRIEDAGGNAFFDADVAVLADGKMAVIFTATNRDNPGDFDNGVFGQLYAADGSVIPGIFQVNSRVVNSQNEPRVAALADGGFVVVWQDNSGADGSGFTTFQQRYDSTGAAVGGNEQVNDQTVNSQFQPDVAGLPNGGWTVTFTDNNFTDGSANGVYSQTYDANGDRQDGAVLINQETLSSQDQSTIASLSGGNYVVAWRSDNSPPAGDGSGSGIFHRLVGDPADFSVGGAPVVDGVNAVVQYDENTVNGIPQLIDANGAAAVSDPDSADFAGGSLLVSNVISSAPLIDQINPPDDLTQDVLGLQQDARVAIAGTDVLVDAVIVGQIVQNGLAGQPFEILLNANATPEVAEVLVEHLTYRNVSDDPLPVRQLRIQLTDGDGAASEPVLVQVQITPTVDAAVPLGGENQANTFETSNQDTPAIATLADGDFLIVWQSNGQDGSVEGIYAQRIDPLGNPVARDGSPLPSGSTDEFQVNSTTANNQFDAAVTGLPDGGFLVTWTNDSSLDGSGLGVFAQRFDANGAMVDPDGVTASVGGSGQFQVNSLTSSTQDQPDIAALEGANAGRWVQVWHSETSGGAGDGNGSAVIGQVFDTDGSLIGPAEFVVNTETLSEQDAPTVTALADGGFFVTWQSFSTTFDPGIGTIPPTADGDQFGIFGQRFDASFNPLGGEIQINALTASNQTLPRVEQLNNGNLIAVWVDQGADGSGNGVFARIFAPDGTLVADQFRVNDQRINGQTEPDVTALDSGGFVITWSDNNGTDGSGVGVFGQQYDANGNRLDSQFQVNTEFSSTQNQPVVTELPNGGFAIAWTSVTSSTAGDGNGNGVFYQIYANDSPAVSPVSAVGDEDTAIVLDETVFEAGFVDPNGQTLQAIRIETLPTQGTLTVNGAPVFATQEVSIAQLIGGALVYTGNQDFFGGDQFLWTGSDGISFAPGLVEANITVNPVNDAPGLEAGANATVAEGQFFQRTLTLTDPDPDNRTISVDFDGDLVADQVFNSSVSAPVISNTFGAEGVFTVTVTVDDNAGQPNSVETDTFTVTVQNAPPVAVNNFISVSEDVADPPFDALANDSDPGNDPLTLTLVNGAAFTVGVPVLLASGATVTVDANGDFIYDPNGAFETLASNQFGNDSFTYTIEDDAGLADTATVNVQIDGQNDTPEAVDDSLSANDDTPIVENVFADNGNGADDDIDGDTFTVTAINGNAADVGNQIVLPSGATVTLQSDGTLDYDPTTLAGSPGSDSFTYEITDAFGATDTATVTVTINATNAPPVAVDDAVATDEDTPLAGGDVLADNGGGADSDPDTDPLTVVAVNGSGANVGNQFALASGALLTLNANGTFTYDPNGQFESTRVGATDTDTFSYTISDGNGGTDQATVTVTINGVNDDPVALNVPDAATEDGAAVTGNVLVNTTDADDLTTLSITEVGGSALSVGVTIPRGFGSTVLIQANGDYTYDPAGGFQNLAEGAVANDFVSFLVSDGDGGTDQAFLVVSVTGVNDAPTALADDFTVGEGVNINGSVFNDNGNGSDFDIDTGDFFTVTAVNGSASGIGSQIALPSGALLTLNASGTFNYLQNGAFASLNSGQQGNDSFTYTITDGLGLTSTATVSITINGNADDPVAQDDVFAAAENDPVNGNVLADNGNGVDFDPNSDPITVIAVEGSGVSVGNQIALASGALLTLNGNGTFAYDPGNVFDSLAEGAAGSDTFTYTIGDGLGGSDQATVTINLTGENDAPVANNDAFGVSEDDAPLNDNVFANNGAGVDSDPDNGDTFTVTAVNGTPASVGSQIALASGALLTLNANGAFAYDLNGAFETLSAGDSDLDTFTYTITDSQGATDTATAFITIAGENDDPVAVDDSFSVIVNSTFNGNVLAGVNAAPDSDIDQNDTLSVTDVNGNTGALGTSFVLPSGATVNMLANGTFTYDPTGAGFTPTSGAPVLDQFTYGIADGNGGVDTATVFVTVQAPGNSPPSVAPVAGIFTEDDTGRQLDLLDPTQVSDPDLDDLDVVNVVVTPEDLRALSFTADAETGLLSLGDGQFEDLAAGETFTIDITYDVTDGTATVANTAAITITGVNDDPAIDAIGSDAAGAVTEDASSPDLTDTGAVLFSDVDLTDSHTAAVLFGSTTHGGGQLGSLNASVSAQTSGTTGLGGVADWTFTVSNAAVQFLGAADSIIETYTVTVDDGQGGTDSISIDVTINGVNDDPAIDAIGSDAAGAVTEDASSPDLTDTSAVLFSDVDLTDSHTVGVSFQGTTHGGGQLGSLNASVSTQTSGTTGLGGVADWTFTVSNAAVQFLGAADSITETYTVTVDDGQGGTDSISIDVTINGVNDDPAIDAIGSDAAGAVTEDASSPDLTDTGAVLFSDVDLTDSHTVGVSFQGTTHGGGQLGSLNASVSAQTSGTTGLGGVADWTFTVSNAAVQFLGASDSITETYTVTVDDGQGGTDSISIDVTINGMNDAPVFVSDNDLTIFENQTAVGTVAAQDPDANDTIAYSIDTAFADGSFFSIDQNSGALSFNAAPDFENPLDAGADNIYDVRVEAFDGTATVTQDIRVEVLDVNDSVTTVLGTPGFDQLSGTAADEVFQSLGGLIDISIGGGADTFAFGAETGNGIREFDYILDFGPDDFLDLGGASIVQEINQPAQTTLILDGDGDLIILAGVANFDENNQLV